MQELSVSGLLLDAPIVGRSSCICFCRYDIESFRSRFLKFVTGCRLPSCTSLVWEAGRPKKSGVSRVRAGWATLRVSFVHLQRIQKSSVFNLIKIRARNALGESEMDLHLFFDHDGVWFIGYMCIRALCLLHAFAYFFSVFSIILTISGIIARKRILSWYIPLSCTFEKHSKYIFFLHRKFWTRFLEICFLHFLQYFVYTIKKII